MPDNAAAARQKLLLQQEIAKLSGAISSHTTRHAQHTSHGSYHPYHRGSSRGSSSFRARGGRARGTGRSYGLDLRAANQAASSSAPNAVAGPSSVKPVLVATPSIAPPPVPSLPTEKEAGELSPSPPPQPEKAAPAPPQREQTWVKGKSGNMSLMSAETSKKLAAQPKRPKRRVQRIPPSVQVLSSSSSTDGPKKVVIDGVIFQFDADGQKLIRIGELDPSTAGTSRAASTPTRRSLQYDGQRYRRTSKGNLIQRRSRSDKAEMPCRFFTKTGRCNRALTCPYKHDPHHIAICPKFLRSSCPNTAATCPLSHSPSAYNTPSCIHFQSNSSCRNGSSCLYPHVRVAGTAPVCEAFARLGWCDAAAGTCPNLHVWECGEWREKGTCSRGAACGLRHVLRAEKGKSSAEEAEVDGLNDDQEEETRHKLPVEGGFEDQADYVGLDLGESVEPSDPSEASGSDGEEASESEDGDDSADEGAPGVAESESEGEDSVAEQEEEDGKSVIDHFPLAPINTDSEGSDAEAMDTDEAEEDLVLGVVS